MSGKDSWYNIITNNWAQITVLLMVIGYFVKTIISWRYKKKEIKFERIQENKIIEIKEFYKSTLRFEVSLRKYHSQTEFGEHSDEIFGTIKKEINECYLDFEYHFRILRLYLKPDEIEIVEDLNKKLIEIRKDITRWHIYKHTNKEVDLKLAEIGDKVFPKVIPELLAKLEDKLRIYFIVN